MKTPIYAQALLLVGGGGADSIDIRYACGFEAPDPFLALFLPQRTLLLVSSLEIGRARSQAPHCECLTPADLALPPGRSRNLGAQARALLRHVGRNRVALSPRCPLHLARHLERAGCRLRMLPDPLFPSRVVKTADELAKLRNAQRAAVEAMRTAMRVLAGCSPDAEGLLRRDNRVLSASDLRLCIDQVLLSHDCMAEQTIIAGGDQAVDPHEPGHGPLPAHQPIVIDIFPRSRAHGYWGDITRTVCRGQPSAAQHKLYRTVLRAQQSALRMVKPGVSGAEIHHAVQHFFEQAGYATGVVDGRPQGFIHGTGHGVGLEIHEAPSIGASTTPLEPGNVITIEPGLYYPGLGGVRIEDTVVVTETGFRVLATCPKPFVL